MYPNLFDIEFLDMYAIMMIIGILSFSAHVLYKFKKANLTKSLIEDLVLILIISGCLMYIGAFGFDALFHSIKDKELKTNGITFLGGLVTALATFIILFCKILKNEKKNIFFFMNIIITGVTIAHAFGRIGCFCAGCCYGKPTDSIFGVTFPVGSIAYWQYGPNVKVFPTQLFEAIFLFILFGVLVFLKKDQFKVYLISYGTFRFFIEFLRGDDRGGLFGTLSPSQVISIILVISGIVLFIINPNQERIEVIDENIDEIKDDIN